jgi:CheY-like chemotaxis protein
MLKMLCCFFRPWRKEGEKKGAGEALQGIQGQGAEKELFIKILEFLREHEIELMKSVKPINPMILSIFKKRLERVAHHLVSGLGPHKAGAASDLADFFRNHAQTLIHVQEDFPALVDNFSRMSQGFLTNLGVERVSEETDCRVTSFQEKFSLDILYAENHSLVAKLIIRSLETAGHDVTHVVNGECLVLSAAKAKYDLILTDIVMPVMHGDVAVRQIKETPGLNQATPVIAITGNSSSSACFPNGERVDLSCFGQNILAKPVVLAKLEQMIQAVFCGAKDRLADGAGAVSKRHY